MKIFFTMVAVAFINSITCAIIEYNQWPYIASQLSGLLYGVIAMIMITAIKLKEDG